MRVRIKSEGFPSKQAILMAFEDSLCYSHVQMIFDILYMSMMSQFQIMGVTLVRYEFQECMVIIQKQYPCDWVIETQVFNF